jgi:hypothetical protein
MQFLSFGGLRPVGVVRVVSGFLITTTLAMAQSVPGVGPGSVDGVVVGVISANPELKAYEAALTAARE